MVLQLADGSAALMIRGLMTPNASTSFKGNYVTPFPDKLKYPETLLPD